MRTVLKITSKGQITFRKEVLRHLGVGPGDKVAIDLLPQGRAQMAAAVSTGSIEPFIGSLAEPKIQACSIDDIRDLAAKGWAGDR